MTLDHIGIAVRDIEAAKSMYEKILNTEVYHEEILESQKVKVAFFKTGVDSKIELLQGTDADSPISKFIEKKGEGIHHTAFIVQDIESEIKRMIGEGFEPLQDKPKLGAAGKLVFFFHPKSTGGVLIELCQKIISH
jgi:methylmalonyl-CoA/ethylmalonyl-CoA epimerase